MSAAPTSHTAASASHHCAACNVSSNSDASHNRHLASKAHRKLSARVPASAPAQAPVAAAAAAVAAVTVSATLATPLPAPIFSSPILSLESLPAASSCPRASASISGVIPSSACPGTVHSPTDINGPSTKIRQQVSVCKSSNKIDDSHESAETDRQSAKSSSSVPRSSNSSNTQQPRDCTICKLTLHNSGDWQTHTFSNAHRKAEEAYVRGMLAAIHYMAKCLPLAPQPSAAAAAEIAASASLPPLTASADVDDFLNVARNPALRVLIASLQQHEDGLAWRSFIRAVAAGIGAVEYWQRNLLLSDADDEDDAAADCSDEDDGFDDEADIYDY